MSKYNNKPVTDDGYTFDSMAEHSRYCELKVLRDADVISKLEVHPRFKLAVNNAVICFYEADFQYFDHDEQCMIVEDVKGVRTSVYLLKKKLMKAIHNISIVEITA